MLSTYCGLLLAVYFKYPSMAAASSTLSSLSAFNGRTTNAYSGGFDPTTRRAPVAWLVLSTVSPSSCHSTKVRNLSLRLSKSVLSFPLYSSSSSATKVKKRNAALAINASAWNDEEEDNRNTSSRALSVYVGNLPFTVDSAELAEIFKGSCNFSMVEVKYNQDTGRSRGFGFVTMDTPEDVAEAVAKFNGYEYQGRALRVNSGPPPAKNNLSPRGVFRSESTGGGYRNIISGRGSWNEKSGGDFNTDNKIYVANFPMGVGSYDLEQLFGDHGKVLDVVVVFDEKTRLSRHFGFVTMSSSEEAEAAIASLDGAPMRGRFIKVKKFKIKVDSYPQ